MQEHGALSERVIGLVIAELDFVRPGLLESVYRVWLSPEMTDAGIRLQSQAIVPVIYQGRTIALGFRADNSIIIEIKAVAALIPAAQARSPTHLRMSPIRAGLLMSSHARDPTVPRAASFVSFFSVPCPWSCLLKSLSDSSRDATSK